MRIVLGGISAVGLLSTILVLGSQQPVAGPDKDRRADREAIHAVLRAQQSAWNNGDVDAFLVGYWRSPEVTFSGSSGYAGSGRGNDRPMNLEKKD